MGKFISHGHNNPISWSCEDSHSPNIDWRQIGCTKWSSKFLKITKLDFILPLLLWEKILQAVRAVSKLLQSKTVDLSKGGAPLGAEEGNDPHLQKVGGGLGGATNWNKNWKRPFVRATREVRRFLRCCWNNRNIVKHLLYLYQRLLNWSDIN